MLIFKLFTVYVYVQTLLCGCGTERRQFGFEGKRSDYTVRRVGRMPAAVPESSGLALAADRLTLWTHNDSGYDNRLFRISPEGVLVEEVNVNGASNVDWEDIATDGKGNLYIGDFGNNENRRRDLRIYKAANHGRGLVDTIAFSFADQTDFPPAKPLNNFDAEALVWHRDSLLLFSKNRHTRTPMRVYALPDQAGNYSLSPTDSLVLRSMITGADMKPDGKRLALLGYGRLYLFDQDERTGLLGGRRACIPIARTGQAEAVVFLPDGDLLISNEGGKIFRISAKKRAE